MVHNQVLAILNGLGESVFIVDANRRILFANPPAKSLFGKDLEGRDFVRAIRHPECLRAIGEVLTGAQRANTVITLETPVRATFDVAVSSLGDDDPDGARAAISLNDVSHIREAEQMRSDFVANVSHELRSPLTTLAGFIETLKGAARDDTEARDRFLGLMAREAQRMTRLISDLLSLSKVEVNERVRPTATANVPAIARRVTTALCEQASQENKKIRLFNESEIPSIPGDEDELTQVFHNLIENSIKYSAPDSDVDVSLSIRDNAGGIRGSALAIEIRDQGEGIPSEHIPRLTERFYRVDTSRSRDKGGTGLGLAIVKHIIKRHRGRLQIRSEPGAGTTVTVLLPMSDERL